MEGCRPAVREDYGIDCVLDGLGINVHLIRSVPILCTSIRSGVTPSGLVRYCSEGFSNSL